MYAFPTCAICAAETAKQDGFPWGFAAVKPLVFPVVCMHAIIRSDARPDGTRRLVYCVGAILDVDNVINAELVLRMHFPTCWQGMVLDTIEQRGTKAFMRFSEILSDSDEPPLLLEGT